MLVREILHFSYTSAKTRTGKRVEGARGSCKHSLKSRGTSAGYVGACVCVKMCGYVLACVHTQVQKRELGRELRELEAAANTA